MKDQTTCTANGEVCSISSLKRTLCMLPQCSTHCSISFSTSQVSPITPLHVTGATLAPSQTCSPGKNPVILEIYSWKGAQGHLMGREKRKTSRKEIGKVTPELTKVSWKWWWVDVAVQGEISWSGGKAIWFESQLYLLPDGQPWQPLNISWPQFSPR